MFESGELKKEGTFEEFSVVRREGNRDVNRTLQFYNLDAIIAMRLPQDRLFQSDFDRYLGELPFIEDIDNS